MSENIQSISQGTFTIGQTSATNFVAGPGISITQPSEGTVRIGNDETVLWSGAQGGGNFPLTENPFNFGSIKIYGSWQEPNLVMNEIYMPYVSSYSNKFMIGGFAGDRDDNSVMYIRDTWFAVNNSGNNISAFKGSQAVVMNNVITQQGDSQYAFTRVYKIVGINRINA